MGQLCVAPRGDWPYLLAPALLLVIVLAIADPTLGGNRLAGILELAVLVGGGVVAAGRLRRARREPRRRPRSTRSRGSTRRRACTTSSPPRPRPPCNEHEPLSVLYLRLEHFEDARNFLGPQGSEELLRGVSRRLQRHLGARGRGLPLRPDVLVAVLPGASLAAAREVAAAVCHDVSGGLINGRRQTLAAGAASFPTVRDLRALLAAAAAEATPTERRRPAPAGAPCGGRTVARRAAARLVTSGGPR